MTTGPLLPTQENLSPRRRRREVYTTGQAARMLCCSPRYIAKLYDSGALGGYTMRHGDGVFDRRFTPDDLRRYVATNGLPAWMAPPGLYALVVGWEDVATAATTAAAGREVEAVAVDNWFQAGLVLGTRGFPASLLLDAATGRRETALLLDRLKEQARGGTPRAAVVVGEDDDGRWVPDWAACHRRPCGLADAAARLLSWAGPAGGRPE